MLRCFRANDIREKTEKLQDEINQLDMDLEEHHGKTSCFDRNLFESNNKENRTMHTIVLPRRFPSRQLHVQS